jgi:endoglucanase
MLSPFLLLARLATLTAASHDPTTFIRVNQVGYLPDAPKVAVACLLDSARVERFVVQDERGHVVFGPRRAVATPAFGPCVSTRRLDFSALRKAGRYRIVAGDASSPLVRIGHAAVLHATAALRLESGVQRFPSHKGRHHRRLTARW